MTLQVCIYCGARYDAWALNKEQVCYACQRKRFAAAMAFNAPKESYSERMKEACRANPLNATRAVAETLGTVPE